jgi:hypothetical protein
MEEETNNNIFIKFLKEDVFQSGGEVINHFPKNDISCEEGNELEARIKKIEETLKNVINSIEKSVKINEETAFALSKSNENFNEIYSILKNLSNLCAGTSKRTHEDSLEIHNTILSIQDNIIDLYKTKRNKDINN